MGPALFSNGIKRVGAVFPLFLQTLAVPPLQNPPQGDVFAWTDRMLAAHQCN